MRAILIAILFLSSGVPQVADAKKKAIAALPADIRDYCVPNLANEAKGIILVGGGRSGSATIANVRCEYRKNDGASVPAGAYGFRQTCPSGMKLILPGFVFPGSTARPHQRLTALIPGTLSDGRDFVDVQVYADIPVELEITTAALCRS